METPEHVFEDMMGHAIKFAAGDQELYAKLIRNRFKLAMERRFEETCRRLEEKNKHNMTRAMITSAMLADICEDLYGENSSDAPSNLAYEHLNWTLGPSKNPHETYYEWAMEKCGALNSSARVPEWKDFLKELRIQWKI